MKILLKCAAVLLLIVSSATAATDLPLVLRAHPLWLQRKMKWEKAPREINPKLSAAAATMVYFAGNGEFGLLSGTVYKEAHRISASAGDGESVYVGTWSADGNTIRVIYQLIYHDIRAVGEQLPGPAQKVNFQFDQATRLLKASGSTGLKLDGWEYEINLELSKATVEAQLGIGMKFGKSDN